MLPDPSTATFCGEPMDVLAAAVGVGGGPPPAKVEMVYCCAAAKGATAISRGKKIWMKTLTCLMEYTLLFRDVPIVEKVAGTWVAARPTHPPPLRIIFARRSGDSHALKSRAQGAVLKESCA